MKRKNKKFSLKKKIKKKIISKHLASSSLLVSSLSDFLLTALLSPSTVSTL
jgi:hypothetical protein